MKEDNMQQRTILVYALHDLATDMKLQSTLKPLQCKIRHVEKKEYLQPVGTLAGEEVFVKVEKEYEGEDLNAPMLVMSGFDSKGVDEVLKLLHSVWLDFDFPYKAVLTDFNKYWTSLMLYEELRKEHRKMMDFVKKSEQIEEI